MPERIPSSSSVLPIDRSDSTPTSNHTAAPNRRPSRAFESGASGTQTLSRREHGASVTQRLRRTLSRSDLTDRVAAFSRRFQNDQAAPPLALLRTSSVSSREAEEVEPPRNQAQSANLQRPPLSERQGQQSSGVAYPYAVPYLAPHPPYSYSPYVPHMHSWAPLPSAPNYPRTQHYPHPHTAGGSTFSPHGYAAYTQPLQRWQVPSHNWNTPSYHSHVVGANSRFGFCYGFGDGPTGEQMHVGFHFNGRFRTLHFGTRPSASRPFFVQTQSGYMRAGPPPVSQPAAPWQLPTAWPHGVGPQDSHQGAVGEHAATMTSPRPWHQVLGVSEQHSTLELVTLGYRFQKRRLESNENGNRAALIELETAYHNALQVLVARNEANSDESDREA
ncbi:hypothetical protein [Burkholderia sp. MSMB1826]|uniref:hypothetical protein n=1 Tax=Burkholderia sp. MSMB1826 TaxID=1637875 RepID=UPI000A9377F2|nr:hypothetical protein [Burkholderia sp. MSMB1826]